MKTFLFASLLSMFVIRTVPGQSRYILEKSSSRIEWQGYKLFKSEITSHKGTIKFAKGQLVLDAENRLIGALFTANTNSIECEDLKGNVKEKTKLEQHLKSADFFDVKRFPVATFVSKHVTTSRDQNFPMEVNGDLTIKDVTKSISFKAKNEIKGNRIYFESEKFTINRKDFKIKYEASYKNVVIKNGIDLKISIMAKK